MRKITLSILLLAAIFSTLTINGQITEKDRKVCGAAELNNEAILNNPLLQVLQEEQNRLALEYTAAHYKQKSVISYVIPVVYHVIHDNGAENISKAEIEASIQNLNEDFQKLNADLIQTAPSFMGIAADVEVEFRLAHLDPNGNCTEGITRTESQLTYAGNEQVKFLVNWDTKKYLNIWVVSSIASGAGGYAYYPGFAPSQNQEGIVIRSAQLGNAITHEVGHYFNLPHCWGNSNTPGLTTNCNGDDGVADTPETIGNQSCNVSAISCGTLDNVQNYMEYSFCETMFTEGQKMRMHSALNSSFGFRSSLWTSANLASTGTADPYGPVICTPIAEFTYNRDFICEGASIDYTDNSYNGIPTAWNWTFTGGSPNTSSLSNPTITYNNPGVYGATHQPATSAGSGSITKSNIITVSSLTADYSGVLVDGFENQSNFNNDWIVLDQSGGQSFSRTTTTAATGNASVFISNVITTESGLEDQLISPSYDLSSLSNPVFKFKVASARTTSASNDRLLVSYSIDCGETWLLRLPLTGNNLVTASSIQSGFWTPNASEWIEHSINLNDIATETNVRFRFLFESGLGNNLFLDDINIDGITSVDNQFNNIGSFNVFPNPTKDGTATISFNLTQNVNQLEIKLVDMLGKEVTRIVNRKSFNQGKYTLNIDKNHQLKSGIYFIQFNVDDHVKIEKLVVQ